MSFGKMGHGKEKHHGTASGTVFSVCFLDERVCCNKQWKGLNDIRTSWPLVI